VITLGAMYDSLDGHTLTMVTQPIIAASEQVDPPAVLIDMTPTKFFGSAFIEVLVKMWNNLRARGGQLYLCGLQKYCMEVLEVTHLDNLWPIYKTREEAIAKMKQEHLKPNKDLV
jgi:anti-anti-sigma factor